MKPLNPFREFPGKGLYSHANNLSFEDVIRFAQYSSTITNDLNVNDMTSDGTATQYVFFNNKYVIWSGFLLIVPSTSASNFRFWVSLPVAASITNTHQLKGCCACVQTSPYLAGNGIPQADGSNDEMYLNITFSGATANPLFVQFKVIYEIIYSG